MGLLTDIDYESIWENIKKYSKKVGRTATRPLLLLYYVMKSDEVPSKDKLTIFGAIAYVILPVDLLNAKRLPIIGWIDEILSLTVAFKRMQKYITPEMEAKADNQLDRWFSSEYTDYEEVNS